jgi:hypothetical protein
LKEINDNKSIVDQIAITIEQRLDVGSLADFRKMYMPRGLCEANFMKLEKKHSKVYNDTKFLNEERKKMERIFTDLPLTYVDKEAYDIEK